jgi:hypothetical protein
MGNPPSLAWQDGFAIVRRFLRWGIVNWSC